MKPCRHHLNLPLILATAIVPALTAGTPAIALGAASPMICELEIEEEESSPGVRETELSFETYLSDPDLDAKWLGLFGSYPEMTPDHLLYIQADKKVSWEAGTLVISGDIRGSIESDDSSPGLFDIEIERPHKKDGTAQLISATGALNPNVAGGGWHEVEVEGIDGVEVTVDGQVITGFLKSLEIELHTSSTVDVPVIEEFELELVGTGGVAPVYKGHFTNLTVTVPGTEVIVRSGSSFEEEVEEEPYVLLGHIEAEHEDNHATSPDDIDLSTLDANNRFLEERSGPCNVTELLTIPEATGITAPVAVDQVLTAPVVTDPAPVLNSPLITAPMG